MTKYTCKVLSIDAWGNRKDGYEWNQCWITQHQYVGDLSRRSIIRFLKANGYLDYNLDPRKIILEDDQVNIVVQDRRDRQPLFAIELVQQ